MDRGIEELLTRGVVEIIDQKKLEKKLAAGKKLRVKLGIDPTSPNLHLGRSVPLFKMRDFQNLGHTAVLIVGDFTGVIGDTSDKESERPILSRETIEENKKHYFDQIGKIVDLKKAELRYNSEWLEGLTYREIGEHADQFSLSDFIDRDNIKRRLDMGKRVSLRETLYPLMQGYDSVAVEADVELGGVDQRFNLLAGRILQEHFGKDPQSLVITTFPILGLDGRKMSSSWGNTVNFTDPAGEMYGKIMSMADSQVSDYFRICTRIPIDEIGAIEQKHPKEAKMRLAFEITKIYHGEKASKDAEEDFEEIFSKGGVPKDIETVKIDKNTPLVEVFLKHKLVASKSEFNRLNKEGAIKEIESGVYRVGKHRFLKIETL